MTTCGPRPLAARPWISGAGPQALAARRLPAQAAALVLLVFSLTSPQLRAAEPAPVFAGVVGHNASLEPGLPPLHYADDDAARYWELLRALGATAELFSVLDPDSQARFPEAKAAARPPTREQVLGGVRRMHEALRRSGRTDATFWFVFSGHGGVGRNYEGYLHLLDGRLTRGELFREVVAPSPAAFNHLILDACEAYFVVVSRGEGQAIPDYRAAVRAYLQQEELTRYPNTGVVLASARDLETHEWSAYEAGVFSHELLSALTGAADLDGDGRVGYAEVRAFLTAAIVTSRTRARGWRSWPGPRRRICSSRCSICTARRAARASASVRGRPGASACRTIAGSASRI